MRFLRFFRGLFYSFIAFILLYVLVGFIPLQLLKENQNIVLGCFGCDSTCSRVRLLIHL